MPLTTLPKVKEYLIIDPTDTSKDSVLTRLINAASAVIENYCHRKFTSAQFTETFWDGLSKVFVENYPITAIASITEDGTAVTGYKNRTTYIDLGYKPTGDVVVTYTGGYATIPDDIDQACIMTVHFFFKMDVANFGKTFAENGMSFKPDNLPGTVKLLLNPYRALRV